MTIFILLMPCWPTGHVATLYVSFFITSEMVSPYYKTRLKMSSCELSFQSIAVQMRRHKKTCPGFTLARYAAGTEAAQKARTPLAGG